MSLDHAFIWHYNNNSEDKFNNNSEFFDNQKRN